MWDTKMGWSWYKKKTEGEIGNALMSCETRWQCVWKSFRGVRGIWKLQVCERALGCESVFKAWEDERTSRCEKTSSIWEGRGGRVCRGEVAMRLSDISMKSEVEVDNRKVSVAKLGGKNNFFSFFLISSFLLFSSLYLWAFSFLPLCLLTSVGWWF